MKSLKNSKFPASVKHGFYTRLGGVSEGIYDGLNCGLGSHDNPEHVQENLRRVADDMSAQHLLTLYQIHSDLCLTVTEPWLPGSRPQADAYVTDRVGIALGILTADCAPVLFCGEKAGGSPVIGAAHAGWKGAIGGVLDQTVKSMLDLGADLESIKAAVGPCIARSSYEVSQDFAENFLEEADENDRFFTASKNEGHLMFDLSGYCAMRLARIGVGDVHLTDVDTYMNEAEFYSYRRKTHRGEADYGRQISVICIT